MSFNAQILDRQGSFMKKTNLTEREVTKKSRLPTPQEKFDDALCKRSPPPHKRRYWVVGIDHERMEVNLSDVLLLLEQELEHHPELLADAVEVLDAVDIQWWATSNDVVVDILNVVGY